MDAPIAPKRDSSSASLALWLRTLSWPMLRAQWGRQLLALLAIALGVALAWGVQLLNASALAEFAAGSRALAGTPDLELRARDGAALPLAALDRLLDDPQLAQAMPLIDAQASAGERLPRLRLVGLDALQALALAPELMPQPFDLRGEERAALQDLLAPDAIYLNEAALAALGQTRPAELTLHWSRDGQARQVTLRIAGRIAARGAPLAVLDIAAAQALFGPADAVARIALRLQAGVDREAWSRRLPPQWQASTPQEQSQDGQRLAEMTRAYRVNLGVLSLMALFSGSFLVFAVLSLGVARRTPQLALLGVLGMAARERQALLLAEAALLGVLGSLLGLALGTGLAWLGLRLLGGDLGAGLLGGAAPRLQIDPLALAIFGLLGLAVALLAAWLPARQAARFAPAQLLKGLGGDGVRHAPAWAGPALLAAGMALTQAPPIAGLPIAAYLAMVALLFGTLLTLPALVRLLLALIEARTMRGREAPLRLLLLRRAREQAGEATQMLAGVLVALALSVAMLVMVTSFRDSLLHWLRQVLPADLYVRSTLREPDGQGAPLPQALLAALRSDPAVQALNAQRSRRVQLGDEPVMLIARSLPEREADMPLADAPLAMDSSHPDVPAVYINEALRDRARLTPGDLLSLRLDADPAPPLRVQVRGVWRDYARQSGALWIALPDYQRASGDTRITELYLWQADGVSAARLQQRVRELAGETAPIEFATSAELLTTSLRTFDRSFAVTYWLQAVALALGLAGVAASLSAQLLARRKELGLLRHLGFTRAELLRLLLGETALYACAGALAGLLLGLGLSLVLVHVVNPQSFHWSMSLSLPLGRLAALLAAMLAAALLTAAIVGRRIGSDDAVRSVREDW